MKGEVIGGFIAAILGWLLLALLIRFVLGLVF